MTVTLSSVYVNGNKTKRTISTGRDTKAVPPQQGLGPNMITLMEQVYQCVICLVQFKPIYFVDFSYDANTFVVMFRCFSVNRPCSNCVFLAAGYYIYIETSFPRKPNDTARLISPTIKKPSSSFICMSFWYHMYGPHVDTLNIYFKV